MDGFAVQADCVGEGDGNTHPVPGVFLVIRSLVPVGHEEERLDDGNAGRSRSRNRRVTVLVRYLLSVTLLTTTYPSLEIERLPCCLSCRVSCRSEI